jgi:hypothetical protein
MDPSIQFLLGNDIPTPEGATIHSIVPPPPIANDDDKIGWTLDVAMRLDQERAVKEAPQGVIIPIIRNSPEELADSA